MHLTSAPPGQSEGSVYDAGLMRSPASPASRSALTAVLLGSAFAPGPDVRDAVRERIRGDYPAAPRHLRAPPRPSRAVVHGGEHRGADRQGAAGARHRRHREGRPDGRGRRAPQRARADGARAHRHGRAAAEGDDRRPLRQHRGRQGSAGPRSAGDARVRARRAHDQLHRRGADARGRARSVVGHDRLRRPARRGDRRRRAGDARRRALHPLPEAGFRPDVPRRRHAARPARWATARGRSCRASARWTSSSAA